MKPATRRMLNRATSLSITLIIAAAIIATLIAISVGLFISTMPAIVEVKK